MNHLLDFLTGKTTDQFVLFNDTKHLVHKEMNNDLKKMFEAASKDGFDLDITSSYRSYETQKKIWDNKALGLKPVLDSNSIAVDISTKSKEEILFLILRWSAIPGGSRHHWGSDLDIFDQRAVSPDYKVQLVPNEYEPTGPFYQSTLWLNENMEHYGFFRPYSIDGGGIAPEPWHFSYRPLGDKFLELYTYELFCQHLNSADFLLLEEALKNSAEIYQRFIIPTL